TPYKDWCFPKCLDFLESKCSLRTFDRQLCQNEFKSHVYSTMNHQSISKSARNKATRLYNNIEEIFNSKEVSTFFERMDVKALEESKRELLVVKKSLFETEVQLTVEDQKLATISSNSTSEASSTGEASKRKREEEQEAVDPSEKSLQYLFGTDVQCSENMKSICQRHNELYSNDSLIDLCPSSNFIKQLPYGTLVSYLKELDDRIENLIPSDLHEFFTNFFQQNLTAVRILRKTLPLFIMAFSMGPQNPLLNLVTLEKPHLNSFVHPCLQAVLWYISLISYEFGEIGSKNHVKRECADGIGYLNTADKFQLVYVEGSRPHARDEKEIADATKISNNLQKIFLNIVKDNAKCRRRLPKSLAVFGGQSFQLRIHLQFMDYCGEKFRLNEVDNTNLPRDFTEMEDFVLFYECVIKWALLAREVKEGFEESRAQKRPSRLSYFNNLSLVDTL
ncbi:17628_t:CDS:2, partial [Funneliformis geosporum]